MSSSDDPTTAFSTTRTVRLEDKHGALVATASIQNDPDIIRVGSKLFSKLTAWIYTETHVLQATNVVWSRKET